MSDESAFREYFHQVFTKHLKHCSCYKQDMSPGLINKACHWLTKLKPWGGRWQALPFDIDATVEGNRIGENTNE